MELDWNFPKKPARGSDGAYRWTYSLRENHNNGPLLMMVRICAAICVPVALVMLALTWGYNPLQAALSTAGFLAVSVGLPALIWVLMPPNPSYKMTEDYIESWPKGKGNNIHRFEGVRRVTMRSDIDCIRLKWRVTGLYVYVPREDFGFVRDFIVDHVPESAEKCYDG